MSVLLSSPPVISEEVSLKHSPRRLLPVGQSVSGGWGAPSEFSQPQSPSAFTRPWHLSGLPTHAQCFLEKQRCLEGGALMWSFGFQGPEVPVRCLLGTLLNSSGRSHWPTAPAAGAVRLLCWFHQVCPLPRPWLSPRPTSIRGKQEASPTVRAADVPTSRSSPKLGTFSKITPKQYVCLHFQSSEAEFGPFCSVVTLFFYTKPQLELRTFFIILNTCFQVQVLFVLECISVNVAK